MGGPARGGPRFFTKRALGQTVAAPALPIPSTTGQFVLLDPSIAKVLQKRGYKLLGEHSAAKLCHWTRESLTSDRGCYKHTFYGIDSHRCIQMTPTVDHCNQHCLFCWRHHSMSDIAGTRHDDPEVMAEHAILAQREMLSGYGGHAAVDRGSWAEANDPRHVAISLAGEATLYPRLGELIAAFHRRGLTTFLVTNGTNPRALERLDPLPTQLYVTLAAPNEEVYDRLCVPVYRTGWQNLMETLRLLPSLDTRKVIRHTLVEGWNVGWEAEYARLDLVAAPHFIESKGYVNVGDSRNHLGQNHMPTHERIQRFARTLAAESGYNYEAEQPESRAVLLMRPGAPRWLPGKSPPGAPPAPA